MTGWQDIQEHHLGELTSDEFELFCADLIQHEAYDRHDDPEFMGPTLGGKDGGRDALLSVSKAPLQSKTDYQREYSLKPLTEDPFSGRPATRTAYSCKTGKNWLDLALRDIHDETRAVRAVEVLCEGGYFKLLISQCVKLDEIYKRNDVYRTPREHLRLAFWDRLKRIDPNTEDPGPRIEIFEASALARYLRQQNPGGTFERWLKKFELDEVLHGLAQWRIEHEKDREQPPMVEDRSRANIAGEILEWMRGSENPIACIVGNPGVGKTRLVLDLLLSDRSIAPRVRVALSPQEAVDAINDRLFRRHRDAILVVDDCLHEELNLIVPRFRMATGRSDRARLLLLIPASPNHAVESMSKSDRVWRLAPLDDEHCRELIARRLGRPRADDDDVAALATFAEGFPWFAQLLADEFEQVTRAPNNMREALAWALASQREAPSHELGPLRLRRARALLATTLAKAIDWTLIEPSAQDALARAVQLRDWSELFNTAQDCERRGLLRRTLGWQFKYVTPQILEREIVRWLLGPDSPEPGGRRLLNELPQQFGEGLARALEHLDTNEAVVSSATRAVIEQLCDSTYAELAERGMFGHILAFAFERRPHETVSAVRHTIERAQIEDLYGHSGIPSRLIWTLETFSTQPDGFADSDAALFRLAQSESIRGHLGPASIAWARLFLVELNMTHAPLDVRLYTLHEHLVDASPAGRRIALRGIEAVFEARALRPAPTAHAQQWPRPQPQEARVGRLRAWTWLMERCDDQDADVRTAARQLAISLLRSAVRRGIGEQAMSLLEQRVASFTDAERVKLRRVLEALSKDDDTLALKRALAPRTFAERLRQRVSVWALPADRHEDASRDDAVVREGLTGDMPLRTELSWLLSPEAKRPRMFAYAMGRGDANAVLFDDILTIARASPDSSLEQAILAHYLGGIAQRGDLQHANELAERLWTDPALTNAAALTLVELGADAARLRWLEHALRNNTIRSFAVDELGQRHAWLSEIGDEDVFNLLTVMAESPVGVTAALSLLLRRFSADDIPIELLDRLLTTLVHTHMTDPTADDWQIGVKLLCERGHVRRAAELAVAAITKESGTFGELAWQELHRAASRDPAAVFRVVAHALEHPETGWLLLLSFQYHEDPFEWPDTDVLMWVGDDEERAIAAANIIRVTGDRLPPVLRELVRRFGSRSLVANEIALRMASPGGVVSDMVEHDQMQLERARKWLDDTDPSIASFAARLVDHLERLLERHAAYEDGLRHEYGTTAT